MSKHEPSETIESLTALLGSASCALGLFDLVDASPLYLNDALCDLVGYSREELSAINGMGYAGLLLAGDTRPLHHIKADFDKGRTTSSCQCTFLRKDGTPVRADLDVSTMTIEGRKCAFLIVSKTDDEDPSFAQLDLFAGSIGSGISVVRLAGDKKELLYANATFFEVTGMDRTSYEKDPASFDHLGYLSPDTRAEVERGITASISTGKPSNLAYTIERSDGKTLWIGNRCIAMRQDKPDTFLLFSFVSDITERKAAEAAVAHEQRRYEQVIEKMHAGILEWDVSDNIVHCSEGLKDYALGSLDFSEIVDGHAFGAVHPDDSVAGTRFISECLDKGHAEIALRLKRNDGTYRWCQVMGLLDHDANGDIEHAVGMIIDVNDAHEKSFMLDSILNELPGGVAIFLGSERLRCLFYSDGFARISDRTRAELDVVLNEGNILDVVYQPDKAGLMDEIDVLSSAGLPLNVTFRFWTKAGDIKWLHLTASKMREERGLPVYYCVFTTPPDEVGLYQSIVENTPIGLLVAERATRRIIFLNGVMRDFFNMSHVREWTGRCLKDIVPENKLLLSDEELTTLPTETYAEYHRTNGSRHLAVRARAIDWNGTDSYVLYVSDETAEHQRNVRIQELINEVPCGIMILSYDHGTIQQAFVNESYFHIFHETRQEHESNFEDLLWDDIHPADRPHMQDALQKVLEGADEISVEFRNLYGTEGNYRWLSLTARVVKRVGEQIVAYCVYSDITESVNARMAMNEAHKKLEGQYRQELSRRKALEKDSLVDVCFDITQNKLADYEVRHGEHPEYRLGMDSADCVSQLLGHVPLDADRAEVKRFLDLAAAKEAFSQGMREASVEYRSLEEDGMLHWVRMMSVCTEDPVSNDVLAYLYVYDIDTEKKAFLATMSSVEEEMDYVLLLDVHSKTIGITHRQGHELSLEHPRPEVLPASEFVSSDRFDDVIEEDEDAVASFFDANWLTDKLGSESAAYLVYRATAPDGQQRRKRLHAFYLDDVQDDIVILGRDVTDYFKEEQRQKAKLQDAYDKASEANRAKSDFLSHMSHEIRTPMNAIMGMTKLARDKVGDDPEQAAKYLDDIDDANHYLLSVIDDILDMSSVERGSFDLKCSWVNLKDVIETCIAMVKPTMETKHIDFTVTARIDDAEIQDLEVLLDTTRVQRMIMNLLNNACKFTPEGGSVSVAIEGTRGAEGVADVKVIISDTGCGMSEEFVSHQVFEPFKQERNASVGSIEGVGLGLAVARQIARAMGGDITATSVEGKGSTFIIEFPCDYRDAQNEPVEGELMADPYKEALEGAHVLVVEDSDVNALIVEGLLGKEGATTERVSDGKQAVDAFAESEPGTFDAILMDIRMPRMDGLEATKAIRALDRADAKTVPLVALSANAFEDDVESSLAVGMNAHLAKPIEPSELFSTLARLIAKDGEKDR